MPDFQQITDCFDKTAMLYAERFKDELEHKPLERQLLLDFSQASSANGTLIDLGCGPGHILQYLEQQGATDLLGIDLSPEMIRVAQQLNPTISFQVGNILHLPYQAQPFGAALAFYSFIYFDYQEITQAFQEVYRILKADAAFLVSFHLGNEMKHFSEFLGQPVQINCHFVESAQIQALLMQTGFHIVKIIERDPYPNIEFQSRRGYFWARK